LETKEKAVVGVRKRKYKQHKRNDRKRKKKNSSEKDKRSSESSDSISLLESSEHKRIHLPRLMMMMIKSLNVNDKIPIDITPNIITRAPTSNRRIPILRTESQVHRPRG
jgi:hypothetical protein